MTATIRARVEIGLRAEHEYLCKTLLSCTNSNAYTPEFIATCAARLDELEAQLANPQPVVERVIAAVEKAKRSMPKHSEVR